LKRCRTLTSNLHLGKIADTILPHKDWRTLRTNIIAVIEEATVSDGAKTAFKKKVLENMNEVSQRDLLRSVCRAINIDVGTDEDAAWRRRNKAAHGVPLPQDGVFPTIRDMKLLMVLFIEYCWL
jgi:hypothetical protein